MTAIQKTEQQAISMSSPVGNADAMSALVTRAAQQLAQMSMGSVDAARVSRMALLTKMAARKNPALLKCRADSLLWSFLDAARCGLEWDGVEGALVPYGDEARFMPMYQGMIRLATSSGLVKKISAAVVYAGDEFAVYRGTEERIHHVPSFSASQKDADIIAVYAVAVLMNGEKQFSVMSREQIERVRASSKGRDRGPWVDWFPAMAAKSAVRQLWKFLGRRQEGVDTAMDVDARAESGDEHLSRPLLPSEPSTQRGTAGLRAALKPEAPAVDDAEAEMLAAERAAAGEP